MKQISSTFRSETIFRFKSINCIVNTPYILNNSTSTAGKFDLDSLKKKNYVLRGGGLSNR